MNMTPKYIFFNSAGLTYFSTAFKIDLEATRASARCLHVAKVAFVPDFFRPSFRLRNARGGVAQVVRATVS
jgi:hypothetical protein